MSKYENRILNCRRYTSYNDNQKIVSVGYRIWIGASVVAPQGRIEVTKKVTGGTDASGFTVDIDCDGVDKKYDQTISIKHNVPFQSNLIPAGKTCVVTERTPANPTGYAYEPPLYSASQTIKVVDKATHKITITNNLVPVVVNGSGCPAGTVPSPIGLLTNSDFAIPPADSDAAPNGNETKGDDGRDNSTKG